jgi:lysozyme
MNLSDKGLAFIQSFEGYHTELPDGGCAAYLCPAGVPTIGHGVTEGVRMGIVWTRQQADEAFRREMAKHEAAVMRLVTHDGMKQGHFDALVSFSYNCGTGALAKSTLLKKFNAGDIDGAAHAFASWNKAMDPKTGKLRPLRGLTRRRAAESAMFLAADDDELMPQAVGKAAEAPSRFTVATVASGSSAGLVGVVTNPPDLAALGAWQGVGGTVASFGGWLVSSPLQVAAVVGIVAAVWLLPKLAGGER